jgi:hypothetical protein
MQNYGIANAIIINISAKDDNIILRNNFTFYIVILIFEICILNLNL